MATAKKSTAKAAPVKSAAKAAAAKPLAINALLNKTALLATLAQHSGQEPKAVKAVLASLEAVVAASLGKKGPGAFMLPGMLKITSVKVPARKARVGIDPFTKQERKFAAKPAATKVKVRVMKKLRDAAGG